MWNFLLISSCSCFFYCFLCCRLSPIPNNSTWYVFFVSIEYIFSSFFRLQEMHTIICIGLFIQKKLFNAIIAPAFEGKSKRTVFFNRLDSRNYTNELSTKQERIFNENDTCNIENLRSNFGVFCHHFQQNMKLSWYSLGCASLWNGGKLISTKQ